MALIHRATITPTKLELLTVWAPTQPWFAGAGGTALDLVGSYRFDDPAGEVGIETLLVRAGDGPVLQVPLTYRGAPLEDGEAALVTTMEHSVLGTRWVYDAVGDPLYRAVLARVVLAGGREAEQHVESDAGLVLRPSTVTVRGSGTGAGDLPGEPTVIVVRAPGALLTDLREQTGEHSEVLTGIWTHDGVPTEPQVLAIVHV